MPVSNKYKFVFIHIPKNAGTSVSSVFRIENKTKNLHCTKSPHHFTNLPALDIIGNRYRGEAFVKGTFISPQHFPASKVRELIGNKKYNNFFKFAFTRNPWDRVVSEFFYRERHPNTWKDQLDFALKHDLAILWKKKEDYGWDSFEGFLRLLNTKLREEDAVRITTFDAHLEPQAKLLDDEMDFIGRFENLHSDWRYVCEQLPCYDHIQGWPVNLPQKNRTHLSQSQYQKLGGGHFHPKRVGYREQHYSEYYTLETKRIVESLFEEDIDRFKYSFPKGKLEPVRVRTK